MKKETTQKSKLWIWIAIAAVALLAAVGVVLALVLGGGEEPSAVEGPQGGRAELYFNTDRNQFLATSTTGLSTREPNADGKYMIRFAHDGELLELTVLDKKLANRIDSQDVMGLVFDENGVVIDQINVRDLATEVAKRVYVRSVEDGVIVTNSSLAMNGMERSITLSDVSEIYDVREDAENLGKVIDVSKLQVMDCITIYANDLEENTHIYLEERATKSKIYWNATRMYNTSTGLSTRTPDEDGVYTIDMYCDGELVTLKCKDKAVVQEIDKRGIHNAYTCLVFDEEGYIISVLDTLLGLPGMAPAVSMDVMTVENGRTVTLKNAYNAVSGITGAETWSGTIPEDCPIYDVSSAAYAEGRRGLPVDEIKVGDRITIWTDMEGKPIIAYISQRMVEGLKPMMLMSRSYNSSTRLTTRTPDADGYYNLEFVISGGGTKVYKTKDKELASYIDSYAERCFGLVTKGDVIVRAYDYECIFGFTRFCTALYADVIAGSVLSASDGPRNNAYNAIMSEDCVVYDISGCSEYGVKTTLKEGDAIIAFRNRNNEVCTIYVVRRYIPTGGVYYNVKKMYNATTKETTRVPDENGWYIFDMVKDGKQTTVKTKDKALASKMENMANQVMGLQVKGDVVQTVFPAEYVMGGWRLTAGGVINRVSGTEVEYHIYGNPQTVSKATLLSSCKAYNISQAYSKFQGEATSIKAGDTSLLITDRTGKVAMVFVRMRKIQTGAYWNVNSMYDSNLSTYPRLPDEEGWYKLDVIRNGKVQTVKTKDQLTALKVDSYTTSAFTLLLNGDEILSLAPVDYATDIHKTLINNYDVEKISGKEVTVKCNRPLEASFGNTAKFNMGSAKVYNVSPNAGEAFGQLTTLQVGDRAVIYSNEEGNVTNIFVTFRNAVKTAYCSHCDKEVVWNPWVGRAFEGENGHFYVYDNCTVYSQTYVANTASDYEVVLDLNGKTVTRDTTGRVFVLDAGETMTILDSVGGGVVQAVGNTGNYTSVVLVTGKATMNLLSGTLKQMESADKAPARGGVVYLYGADATFNMMGGEIIGGKVVPNKTLDNSRGGAVYLLQDANFNMSGGTITGGTAQLGGAVTAYNNSSFTMTGGTITGGTAAADANFGGYGYGGNVYIREGSTFTMTGGTITGGTAERGGNVYACINSKLIISGGTIEGGSALRGGNVYIDNSEATVTDGTITGGKATGLGANVMMATKAKLNLLGGSITDGVVDATGAKYATGGNIYAGGGNTEINVAGGTISGGVVKGGSESNYGANISLACDTDGSPAILNITAGSIEGGNAPNNGGNVYLAAGTEMNVIGGTVKGGTAQRGGNIFAMGTLNVKGGEILGGFVTASHVDADGKTVDHYGSNVYVAGGTTTISGGKIANGGALDGARGGNIAMGPTATVNMTGGIIENGLTKNLGGNINSSGTFNMSGGQILGGQSAASGGSIGLLGGVFNITGGTIDGFMDVDNDGVQDANATGVGGLFYIWKGELNISGDAVVKNGKAGTQSNLIYVSTDQATAVNISGGTLSGGAAYLGSGVANITGGTYDGGITVKAGVDLTIGKTAKITATNDGLSMEANAMMKLDALEEGAEIYVKTAANNAPFTVANEKAAEYAKYFKTGSEDAIIGVQVDQLIITAVPVYDKAVQMTANGVFNNGGIVTAECPVCEEEVQWAPVTADTYKLDDGEYTHWYLHADETISSNGSAPRIITSVSGSEICLHLNGKTYSQPASYTGQGAIVVAGGTTMNIMGDGVVKGSGFYYDPVKSGAGGAVDCRGTLNIYGGTYMSTANYSAISLFGGSTVSVSMHAGTIQANPDVDTTVYPLGNKATLVYLYGSTHTFNMYGGEIKNGQTTDRGGNIRMSGGTFNLCGGEIKNGVGNNLGGNINIAGGTFNMTGGTISGGKVNASGGSIGLTAGTLNISGGIIDGYLDMDNDGTADNNATNGGLIYIYSGTVNISGTAELKNGMATNGSGLVLGSATANVNISGGTLTSAHHLMTNGVANITGGTIKGIVSVDSASNFTIGKTAKILAEGSQGLQVRNGAAVVKLATGNDALVEGAEIYVTAVKDTVFSNANDNAAAYANTFIKSAVANTVIEATAENTLKIVDAPAQG